MYSRSPEYTSLEEFISPEQNEPIDSHWTTARIRRRLQITEFEVRMWSEQMRLLEARTKGGLSVFPSFQFVQKAGVWSVLTGLHEVLEPFKSVIGDNMSGWELASLINAPSRTLDDKSIVDYLKQGGDVTRPLAITRNIASNWSK